MWICEYVIGKKQFWFTWKHDKLLSSVMIQWKKEHSLENGNRERAGIAAMSCVWTCAHNCNIKV